MVVPCKLDRNEFGLLNYSSVFSDSLLSLDIFPARLDVAVLFKPDHCNMIGFAAGFINGFFSVTDCRET